MKKTLIAISLCLVMVTAFATPAFAASKGAVKADMVVHTDSVSQTGMPAGTVVGSVILNTTGTGYLIVVVNLDDATPIGAEYDSLVWINGTRIIEQVAVDILRVNGRGQATANYKVDLGSVSGIGAEDTSIQVKVVVRPSFSPNTFPCYVTGPSFSQSITVPLKK